VRHRKALLAFGLIALLAVPNVSAWLNFKLQTQYSRKNARQIVLKRISSSEFETFVFSKDFFAEIRLNEFEFELNGEMYDIVLLVQVSDSVTIRAWRDTPESSVKKQYRTIQAGLMNQNPTSNNLRLSFLDFSKNLFCVETDFFSDIQFSLISHSKSLYLFSMKEFNPKLADKPPKLS